ncbi:hypothetical protein B0H12DRAFT_1233792 [Mycena haematopus]|nr:hypothetical protein B0H12DRAFT_1233792 [Mycena haematopus]
MTSPTPGNRAADDSKYLALWTPDDKRFCAYWRHPLVLPLLHDIIGFKTITENWEEFKDAVVRDINAAFPVLCLMKREFTEQMLEDVDVVLLDVWYGYTRLLSKLGTGPPDWKAVCIHESYKPAIVPEGFWFPPVDGITINKSLRSLVADPSVSDPMPKDPLLPSRPVLAVLAPTVVASSSRTSPRTPEPPTPSQPSKKRRSIEEDAETMRAAVLAFEASGSPLPNALAPTLSSARAMTASKPPGYGGSSQSGKTKPSPRNKTSVEIIPDSEEEEAATVDRHLNNDEDNDDDVEMADPPSPPAKKDGSSRKPKGKKKGTSWSDIDPQEYAQSISSAIVKRQGNRKATGPLEFNFRSEEYPHVLSLIRLGTTARPTLYNGFPVDMPGKRAKTVGSPLEGKKLTMAELSVITSEVNIRVVVI